VCTGFWWGNLKEKAELNPICHFLALLEAHHILYVSKIRVKSRRMRWAGYITYTGERRGVYRVLVGKPEGKRSLGRPRCRWENNIKMDHQEVGCGSMDGIDLAQEMDRWQALVKAGIFLTSSRRTLLHGVSR